MDRRAGRQGAGLPRAHHFMDSVVALQGAEQGFKAKSCPMSVPVPPLNPQTYLKRVSPVVCLKWFTSDLGFGPKVIESVTRLIRCSARSAARLSPAHCKALFQVPQPRSLTVCSNFAYHSALLSEDG